MKLLPLNLGDFGVHGTYRTESPNNVHKTNYNYGLNTDTVSFSGAAKFISSPQDRALIDILSRDLELTKEAAAKLKNIVWDFLRKNKVTTLEELRGEKHETEQVELTERIADKLNIPDADNIINRFIAEEIVNCCEEGKKYIPGGIRAVRRDMEMEKLLMTKGPFAFGRECHIQEADKAYYDYVRRTLRLTPMETYEFRITVEDFLKENKLTSLEDFRHEENLGKDAELTELLEEKFGLDEHQSMAISMERMERAFTVKGDYVPDTPIYASDIRALYNVLKNSELNKLPLHEDFNADLYYVMANEAEAMGYKYIFDIFKAENKPFQSKTYKFLQKSGLSQDQIQNLILDMQKVAKDPEEFASSVPKFIAKDNFYAGIQAEIFFEQISEKYGISPIERKQIITMIKQSFPEQVRDGKNVDIKQIAFEIADKYKLPSGAEKDIENIWANIRLLGTTGADAHVLSKLMGS